MAAKCGVLQELYSYPTPPMSSGRNCVWASTLLHILPFCPLELTKDRAILSLNNMSCAADRSFVFMLA